MKDNDPYNMRDMSDEEIIKRVVGFAQQSEQHQYAMREMRRREHKPSEKREWIIITISIATLLVCIATLIVTFF